MYHEHVAELMREGVASSTDDDTADMLLCLAKLAPSEKVLFRYGPCPE
jgi:hypothetical protein